MSLNKSQQRELDKVLAYMPVLGADFAARSISALHRAAPKASQQRELMTVAVAHGLDRSAEFIV
jgi:hypothetical protein